MKRAFLSIVIFALVGISSNEVPKAACPDSCVRGNSFDCTARKLSGTNEYPGLQSFPLDHPGEHVFHFHQDQKGEMTLLLEVEGARRGERDRQELAHLGLTIEVALVDNNGHMVCHAVGSPTDGMSTDNWVVRAGHGKAAFWHNRCAEMKLKRSQYTLTVRLRDVDPKTPKIEATPVFERSDNYAP